MEGENGGKEKVNANGFSLSIIKKTEDSYIEGYKTKLAAKGYTITLCIDYQETLVLITKMNSIKVLLSLAVSLDQTLHLRNIFSMETLKKKSI